jgi:hypothetical protein
MRVSLTRAWLIGYGSRLVPRTPFEIARLGEGDRVVFAHHGDEGVRSLMVAPDANGTRDATRVGLGPGTASMADVLDFVEDEDVGIGWQVMTREHACAWPTGTTLWSTPYEVDWPFELAFEDSPRDRIVYVQGPWPHSHAPAFEQLVADGMQPAGGGELELPTARCAWMELHYQVDQQTWAQRRWLVPLAPTHVVLVTAQSDAANAATTWAVAEHIARTLRPR